VVDDTVLAFLEQQQQLQQLHQQQAQFYDDYAYEVMMQRALEESAALEALEHEQEEFMLRQALALSVADSAAALTVPLDDLLPRSNENDNQEPPPLEDFSPSLRPEPSATTVPPHVQDSSDESDIDDLPGLIPSHTLPRHVIRQPHATTTIITNDDSDDDLPPLTRHVSQRRRQNTATSRNGSDDDLPPLMPISGHASSQRRPQNTATSHNDSDDDVPPLMPMPQQPHANRQRHHGTATSHNDSDNEDVPPLMPMPQHARWRQQSTTTSDNDSDDDVPPLLPPEPPSSSSIHSSPPPSSRQQRAATGKGKASRKNGSNSHHHHQHRRVVTNSSSDFGLEESPATADASTVATTIDDGEYGASIMDDEEALNEVPFLQFLYHADDTMVVWNDYYSFARRLGSNGSSGTTSGTAATTTGTMNPVNPDQRLLLRLLSHGSHGDDDRRSRRR
jgi:hypothetical protein